MNTKGLLYPNPCPHCGKENTKKGCYEFFGKQNGRKYGVCMRGASPATGWEQAYESDGKTPRGDRAGNSVYQEIIPYAQNGKSSNGYTQYHKPEAEWYYHDKQGNPLVKIARCRNEKGEKYYPQYHYTSDGKWEKGVKDYVNREDIPIYRYIDIRDAIKSGSPIWIVEGEKCVDQLWDKGIFATCNIGGAGKTGNKWKPSDTACLEGAKEIILCPDQDKPGVLHMKAIYKQLIDAGFPDSSIKWLYAFPDSKEWDNLPENHGLDIFDWIEDGADYRQIISSVQDNKKEILIQDNLTYTSDSRFISNNLNKKRHQEILDTLNFILYDQDGNRKKIYNNVIIDALDIIYGKKLRYNLLTFEPWLDDKPFKEVEGDLDSLHMKLANLYQIETGKEKATDALLYIAKQQSFHPVKDYLRRCEKNVQPADIDNLAERYFGLKNELFNSYLKLWLLAAAARPIYPGCYVRDVLVLQGKQNIGKSTFFRILGGEFFSDSLGDAKNKDQLLIAGANWILEWAEIEAILGKKLIGEAKNFITATSDCLRRPYGRSVEVLPRGFILCGTCNEHTFFNDSTGNDRYRVIPVKQKVPLEQLKKERDAIWLAATRIVLNANIEDIKSGNLWRLPTHLEEANIANTEKYAISHEWEEDVQEVIDAVGSSGFILADAIWQKLEIDPKDKARHGAKLYNLMTKLGWRKSGKLRSGNKKRHRVWMITEMEERDIDELWEVTFPELEKYLKN